MMKPSIQQTNEERIAYLKRRITETLQDIDWEDAEARIWKAYGRYTGRLNVLFCMTNYGKDEWWQ